MFLDSTGRPFRRRSLRSSASRSAKIQCLQEDQLVIGTLVIPAATSNNKGGSFFGAAKPPLHPRGSVRPGPELGLAVMTARGSAGVWGGERRKR
jgi:hypothetical protein